MPDKTDNPRSRSASDSLTDAPQVGRVMIVHQAALGDWVLVFPLLRGLVAGGWQVTVITGHDKGRLVQAVIEPQTTRSQLRVMDIEHRDWSIMFADGGHGQVSDAGRKLWAASDWVISAVSTPYGLWADNAARLLRGGRCAFIDTRPPADHVVHVADWQADQLQAQGLSIAPVPPLLRENTGGPIVIHPGSGGHNKCWPIQRYEQTIDRLRAANRDVRVLLGEVEINTWPQDVLKRWQKKDNVQSVEKLTHLCEAIASAAVYVGNDSGPTHLAAQCGLPTIALFGPTDPRVWRPRGPRVKILAPPSPAPMTWLAVDAVLDQIAAADK